MKEKSKKFIKLCEKLGVNPEEIPEIMSIEAAFEARKIDIKKMPVVSMVPKRFRKWLVNLYKAVVLTEAMNMLPDGRIWIPKSNEIKWEIWWNIITSKANPSGSGLALGGIIHWGTYSTVPGRLCFRTKPIAEFAAKHKAFAEVYKNVQLFFE